MTRERAKELLPIIKAYSEGQVVQVREEDAEVWNNVCTPSFLSNNEYRIKPEPREFVICTKKDKSPIVMDNDGCDYMDESWEKIIVREILDD
jgi:hypothetical protein